jgi:hypothetical protein
MREALSVPGDTVAVAAVVVVSGILAVVILGGTVAAVAVATPGDTVAVAVGAAVAAVEEAVVAVEEAVAAVEEAVAAVNLKLEEAVAGVDPARSLQWRRYLPTAKAAARFLHQPSRLLRRNSKEH